MKNILLAVISAISAGAFAAPAITDVTIDCTLGKIRPDSTITFTLTGDPNEKAIVTFALERDGKIVDCPYVTFSGDDCLNRVISQGTYSFKWDSAVDWPDQTVDTKTCRVLIKAWSLKSPPDYLVYNLKDKTEQPRYYLKAADLPGGVQATVYKTDKLVMRRIHAAGKEFLMGMNSTYESGTYSSNSKPTLVGFTKDYYIGVYEVTVGQHLNVKSSGNTQYTAYDNAYGPGKSSPNPEILAALKAQTDVARSRAGANTQWWYYWNQTFDPSTTTANMIMRAFQTATQNPTMFLPTHAQWEFACRADTSYTPYYDINCKRDAANAGRFAWFADNNEEDLDWYHQTDTGLYLPHVVGLKEPNAWGLYDMLGNVHELCIDIWRANPGMTADGTPVIDPRGNAIPDSPGSGTQLTYAGGSLTSPLTGSNGNTISCGFMYPLRGGSGQLDLGHRLKCDIEATR